MHCLRCGIETEGTDIFCADCREFMKKDPVSRETPVPIYPRPAYHPMRKRPLKPEELIAAANARLEKATRLIVGLGLLCLVLLVVAVIALFLRDDTSNIGRNYTTIMENLPPIR